MNMTKDEAGVEGPSLPVVKSGDKPTGTEWRDKKKSAQRRSQVVGRRGK
jgi:hypothetical protein